MRKIPDNNLAYPVLINTGVSTGTGFFLNTKNAVYLITAHHVLYNKQTGTRYAANLELTCYPTQRETTEKTSISVDLSKIEQLGGILSNPGLDVSVLLIFTRDNNINKIVYPVWLASVTIASGGLVGIPIEGVRHYSDVMISNEAYVLGYPVSLGLPNIPQIDYARPLLRRGIVAGKNDALKTLILDCPVYPGNSGGPVIEVEENDLEYNYRVIGVVSQYVPTIANVVGATSGGAIVNSGYSIAAAMDGVLELVTQIEIAIRA